jgi:hypothetical protein
MKHQVIFGIISEIKEEKKLHNKIKEFLASLNRTTSTAKNPDMLSKFLPFRIKQYHWNLNKEMGTFITLFPNIDLDGKTFIPSKPEYGWLLQVLFHEHYPGYEKIKSEKYILELLNSTNFEFEIVYETESTDSVKYGEIK